MRLEPIDRALCTDEAPPDFALSLVFGGWATSYDWVSGGLYRSVGWLGGLTLLTVGWLLLTGLMIYFDTFCKPLRREFSRPSRI